MTGEGVGPISLEQEALHNFDRFVERQYPGRGFILGSGDNPSTYHQLYFLTGRSAGTRNREFERTDENSISTRYHDESLADHTQDHLVIYRAMVDVEGRHFVANGRQIERAIEGLGKESMTNSLSEETFEPDSLGTARVTGLTKELGPGYAINAFHIVYKDENGEPVRKGMSDFSPQTNRGIGRTIHTYDEGDPPPPYTGPHYPLPLKGTPQEIVEKYWEALGENKIAVLLKTIDLESKSVEVLTKDIHDPRTRII